MHVAGIGLYDRICIYVALDLLDNNEALAQVNPWFVSKHLASKQDGVVHVWLVIWCRQVAGSE